MMDNWRVLVTGGSGFIGTYLINDLLKQRATVCNIDIKPPQLKEHELFWKNCDILDKDKLLSIFSEFNPTHIVHLAARTDTDSNNLPDYKTNTEGTANVLEAIKNYKSIEKVIITSTQFVNQYNGLPKHDEDYAPHTVYGESKVITEQLTRKSLLPCCWTIIRPTNIWGPRHPRYAKEFWYVLKQGKYIHPSTNYPVIRSYGYVGNVTFQIMQILKASKNDIDKQVLYVGDEPIDLYEYVNLFSRKLTGRNVKTVPSSLVKMIAYGGDLLKLVNIKFPITSSRYKSMTTSNGASMQKTVNLLGPSPFSLAHGVNETYEWLKTIDKDFWSLEH